MDDITEPVNEVLHQPGHVQAIDRGSEYNTVRLQHLLFYYKSIIVVGALVLSMTETGKTSFAGQQVRILKPEIFKFSLVVTCCIDSRSLSACPERITLTGAAHDNKNFH